ncbi:MAG: F-type H+-transporting ATPase subunit delta [Cellvibrionaceae bacterium]|jgi:F-type H+-transporting ATPase subunit delta
MAELTTLARPYARAAFEFARENKGLDSWSSSLAVAAAVSQDNTVAKLLYSPTLTAKQKAAVLTEICGDKLQEKVKAFIVVLAENKRLGLLGHISNFFESLKAQQEKFSDVQVVSAFELDSSVEKSLADKLKMVFISDVALKIDVDASLIGGVIIRSGDTVIDGSIKGRLNKLAESFGL